MWSQTPQFTLAFQFFGGVDINIDVHHGLIKALHGTGGLDSISMVEKLQDALVNQRLQDIDNWDGFLRSRVKPWNDRCNSLVNRLEELLPIPNMPRT
jgi:lipoate-protein ligase A